MKKIIAKQKLVYILAITMLLVGCSTKDNSTNKSMLKKQKEVSIKESLEAKNAKLVVNVIKALDKKESGMIEQYYADQYIEHSPKVKDGKVGLYEAINIAKEKNISTKREIVRVVAENNLVFVQSRAFFGNKKPSIEGDLFKIENGKITEHWNVWQEEVPKSKTANGNSMIDGSGDTSKKMTKKELERNKQTIKDFIHIGFAKGDKTTLKGLFGNEYIQHNPHVPNGKEAVLGFMKDGEGFPAKIHQIVAQGDLVAVLVEYGVKGDKHHNAVVDIFRLDDKGKAVEHWDMGGQIPDDEDFAHNNGIF